jgi:uncharacterized protein (TIGR04255 family)
MAAPGRLRNPPIQEVLVDLRIANTVAIDRRMLQPLQDRFRTEYPNSEPINRFEAQIQAQGGRAPAIESRDIGFHGLFLRNERQTRVVQFRTDGFTLNQLGGYTTADDLFAEACPLWQGYADVVRPARVIRIAVRYINRLALPFRDGDPFERFLTAPVTLPPDAPQQVANFFTRAVLNVAEPIDAVAIVTQNLEHAVEQATPFVLDIDVYKEEELSILWTNLEPLLQRLRIIKNNLFFAFLTDAALEPYR